MPRPIISEADIPRAARLYADLHTMFYQDFVEEVREYIEAADQGQAHTVDIRVLKAIELVEEWRGWD